jgi:polyisoprenoid-binding protein YceI
MGCRCVPLVVTSHPLRITHDMRIKNTLLLSCALVGLLTAGFNAPEAEPFAPPEAGTYVIDAGHSCVLFKIKHMQLAYCYGRFDDFSGTIVIAEKVADTTVEFEIKTASVDSASEGRDRHIKGPDFLNVEEFPVATFKSTKVSQKKDVYTITGDLTMHGVTQEASLDMGVVGSRDTGRGYKAGFEGTLEFDRTDFKVGSTFNDEALSEKMSLIISVETKRK